MTIRFGIIPAILLILAPAALAAKADPMQSSPGWLEQVQRDLEEREYEVSWQAAPAAEGIEPSWHAPNRAQGFRSYFTPDGIRVLPRTDSAPSWRWGLSLVGYGSGEKTWVVPAARLSPAQHRMDYRRGAFEERYENTARGLKQSFILPAPPGEARAGVAPAELKGWSTGLKRSAKGLMHLDLALWGDLSPRISQDGQAIDFVTPSGAPALRYSELVVTDARGRTLSAWMEGFVGESLRGIRLVVDAHDAVYPITVDPLMTGAAWTAEGNQAGAAFGIGAGTAGDVNGDGYSDVIIGAFSYDNGQADEGRAYVYLGSASGLSLTPVWTAESDQTGSGFGGNVGTAGDVNGDGYSDVTVGANRYDNGELDEGRAYVYLGSASGPSVTPAWTKEGDQISALFGGRIATAGDVNADGYSDVIVGVSQYDNGETDEGRAYVYMGSALGLSATPAWTRESDQAGALFGLVLGTAGDVNGDGYGDVIVAAHRFDNGETDEGRAYVYLGSTSGLSLTPAWTAEGNQSTVFFGARTGTAGDVNGDGYADVIVGATLFSNGEFQEGRAYVYLGSAAGLSATPAWTAEGDVDGAQFGYVASTAGDVNGDGYADIFIGAATYQNGQSQEGRAYVYLGSASGPAPTAVWTVEGDQVDALLGITGGTAGDVNGDGYADIIVGASGFANGETGEGRAFVYLGSASGPSSNSGWMAEGNQASAQFGSWVGSAGDVNGDGYADILVGARRYDNGETDEGRAYLYLGSASGAALTPAWTAEGDQADAQFGFPLATAGDVNGDGYSDVLVGAGPYDNGETNEGRAYLYLGSASGLAPTPAWTAEGNQAGALFGFGVATAGDVNGDGYSDVLISARFYDNGESNEGRAFLYLGSASGLALSPAWTAESDQADAVFGFPIGTAGDVNRDGLSDVIVGALAFDNGETDEGRAYLYLGSASGLSLTPAWTAESDQAGALFGIVGTAGDVNGDGYSDVVIGADNFDNGQTNEGKAYLYLGSSSGLAATPAWTAEGDQQSAQFGISVAVAGDVNGDGYSDFIVGEPGFVNGALFFAGRAALYLGSASGPAQAAAWSAVGDQTNATLGNPVATAGDVNGDGYADVIAGAQSYDNGETGEGRAFVYYGNGGRGLSIRPQQRRSDNTAPIAPGCRSDDPGSFRLDTVGRTPFGRSRVRLEWEVKPLGTLFNGSGTQQNPSFMDTGTTGVNLNALVSGLSPGAYHWRVRFHYEPVSTPFAQSSRWFTVPWNGWQEADLRLAGLALGGFVWDDLNADGIRQAGEPGHGGVLVRLIDSDLGDIVASRTTLGNGSYDFPVAGSGPYQVQLIPPGGFSLTLEDRGADDTIDSDPIRVQGITDLIGPPITGADGTRWGAGLVACSGPSLPVAIVGTYTAPGTNIVIYDFSDPNPEVQVTGFNVYRSTQPQPPPAPWSLLASDVADNDPVTPGVQWSDVSGVTPPPGSAWFYQVTAFHHDCNSEGPR